ncbi:MAG: prolipoprotein diacylglyceryl transferase [Candidatus Doudnabacteria bacterium]
MSAIILWFVLSLVFGGSLVLPQGFDLFGFEIRYYGLILATAVWVSFWVLQKQFTKNFSSIVIDQKLSLENFVVVILVCGFIGARAYHVVTDFELYRDNLVGIVAVWNGGLSIFGAVAGGFIGAVIVWRFWLKNLSISLLQWLDVLAPSVLVGQIIGRLGNLFNYEAYGLPTNLPWKMFVPVDFRSLDYLSVAFYHTVFLYEMILGLLLLWLILKRIESHYYVGKIFATWLVGYGLIRLVSELFRLDHHDVAGISINYITPICFILIGLALYFWRIRFKIQRYEK